VEARRKADFARRVAGLSDLAAAEPLKADLLGLSRARLREALAGHLDRPYRAEQLFRAIYEGGVEELSGVTTLGRGLRDALEKRFRIGRLEVVARERSHDGTEKLLLKLRDGAAVEAVSIPEARRRTLCVSSQAGCALACRFCVTGFWGAGRDLTAGEIVGQVLALERSVCRQSPLNLVFMGMGEPLLNLTAVEEAMTLLSEWISWRRITLSTVGILPALEAVARWPKRPNLAISLHAPDAARRREIMPVEERYPLAELLDALRAFPLEPGRRITFEYVLIAGFNDAAADADQLARLLNGLRAKVNLIPLNWDPVLGEAMRVPDEEAVDGFHRRLKGHGVVSTVRRSRGLAVSGACGQLRAFSRPARGFPPTRRDEVGLGARRP
jgi:23S rRNA (adenine2503-C2)-methyltransferase